MEKKNEVLFSSSKGGGDHLPLNLNFARAGERGDRMSIYPDPAGEDRIFTITSYRTKFINGKNEGNSYVGDIAYPSLSSRDWVHQNYTKRVTHNGYPAVEISLKFDANPGALRETSLVYTQNPSGKKVTVDVHQSQNGPSIVETKYFCVGDPEGGKFLYDPLIDLYATYTQSTLSTIVFRVYKADIYSDHSVKTQAMGVTDSFEISQENPLNGGFQFHDSQGTDSISVSTKGGSPGTHFGWFYIRFSQGDMIGSNRIELYQQ